MSAPSGLADARRQARASGDLTPLLQRVPYAGFLGILCDRPGKEPRFRLPFREMLVGERLLPAIHGGVVAGFMEAAAQLHLLFALDEQRLPKVIDFSIDYLRPGNPADCYAACSLSRQGRRVALVQVRCWQTDADCGDERELALARVHFLLTDPDTGG